MAKKGKTKRCIAMGKMDAIWAIAALHVSSNLKRRTILINFAKIYTLAYLWILSNLYLTIVLNVLLKKLGRECLCQSIRKPGPYYIPRCLQRIRFLIAFGKIRYQVVVTKKRNKATRIFISTVFFKMQRGFNNIRWVHPAYSREI